MHFLPYQPNLVLIACLAQWLSDMPAQKDLPSMENINEPNRPWEGQLKHNLLGPATEKGGHQPPA